MALEEGRWRLGRTIHNEGDLVLGLISDALVLGLTSNDWDDLESDGTSCDCSTARIFPSSSLNIISSVTQPCI